MRYRPRRAASRCPQDRFWHSAPEAPLWWTLHVSWSTRPGESNLGQEGRLGRICLLLGSTWETVAVPGEPDLIYVELLMKPEAPRLGGAGTQAWNEPEHKQVARQPVGLSQGTRCTDAPPHPVTSQVAAPYPQFCVGLGLR